MWVSIRLGLLVLVLLTVALSITPWTPSRAEELESHSALCPAGQVAVCAKPGQDRVLRPSSGVTVSYTPDLTTGITSHSYRPRPQQAWRVVLDVATGLGSEPNCSCLRKAERGAMTVTCTCTGGR